MRKFKCCAWCGQYTIEPDREKIDNQMIKIKRLKNSKQTLSVADRLKLKAMYDEINDDIEKGIDFKCRYCNESLMEMGIMNDNEFIAYSQKLYQEFVTFMGNESANLPQKIDIRLNTKMNGALADYDEESKMFYVEINPFNYMMHKHDVPPILFHEFTHIYQMYDPKTGGKNEKIEEIKLLCEYLASIVQIKKRLGYKNINENKNISLSNRVIYKNETLTLKEYFDKYLQNTVKLIKKDHSTNDNMSIFMIGFHILYYLGEASILKGYIDKELYKQISNISELEKELLDKVVCNEGELLQSFKCLENYIINTADDDLDGYVLHNMFQDTGLWIGKHIPDFQL